MGDQALRERYQRSLGHWRYAWSIVCRQLSRPCALLLLGPGHRRRVPAAARIYPGAGIGVAIVAKRTFIVGRGAFLATPNHQGVALYFIHIIEGAAHRVII